MDPASDGSSELSIRLSESEEEQCREYGRSRFQLAVAEFLLLLAVLAGLSFTGAAAGLLAWTRPAGIPDWLGHLAYLVGLGVIVRLTLLPIQFLSESWLDRRYGISRQCIADWFYEWLCRTVVLGLATIAVLFPVVETLQWWLYFVPVWCIAFLLLRPLFFEYVYYPFLACFYPVHFLRHECFLLPGIGKVTLPVYQVTVSHKTRRANAAIRMRGKKTAIYVSDTLIDEFTDGEERVVMAHEFGHLYDQLHLEERTRAGVAQASRKLGYGSIQLLAAFISVLLMHFLGPVLGFQGEHDLSAFPLLAGMTLLLTHLVSPLLYAEARRDERDADEYALAVTGDVANYVSVMRKLRWMNLEESCAHPLSRFLFDTHPSYDERVHLAMQYRRRFQRRRKSRAWRGWRNIQRHGRR